MAIRALSQARFLTAVSPYLVQQIRRFTKVPSVVIPNPMPNMPAESVSAMQRDGIRDVDAPLVAMILNGWGRRKNPMMGLKAFSLLRSHMPSARLRLYGNDFGPGQLAERLARARGLIAGVEFIGSVPYQDLMAELSKCNVLLHPSLEESSSLALIEAMALGVPAVAGNASGAVPWVLDHGQCGVLTDVRSANAMCEALLQLFQDRGRYNLIREAAARRTRDVFGADAVAQQYEQQYFRAIKGTATEIGT
jgi:glycosyltransferase involved in cell wall biosynthesis